MGIAKRIMRMPEARRFDRNCVLAATAGQLIAAHELGVEVAEVLVGATVFDVGTVAKDIRLAQPQADRKTATVAAAGSICLGLAAGMTNEQTAEGIEGERLAVWQDATMLLDPWFEDGRFVRLVRELDVLREGGRRVLG